MRIHVLSDLHTEFAPFDFPPVEADVTVLAGDVGIGLTGLKIAQQLPRPVVYVAGNHEYYGGATPHLTDKLRAQAAGSNVTFLEDGEAVIAGVRFLGCTLWTDFSLFGFDRWRSACDEAQATMVDYRRIRNSPAFRKLCPRDTALIHTRSRAWLKSKLEEPCAGPTVVVTHHAPHANSLAPAYRQDLISAAYATDLSELLGVVPRLLWIHGHTHHAVDYPVGVARVLSNPRGYAGEITPGFRPDLVIDV